MKFRLLKIGLMMEYKIISIFLICLCVNLSAQQYHGKDGMISFFSEAPFENIPAINKKVQAIYDSNTNEIVFQLNIKDFVFPKKLMQEHFNENYLESDIFPKSTFEGKIIDPKEYIKGKSNTVVEGDLTIHGATKKVIVEGYLLQKKNKVHIQATFSINLKDYNIEIPKIVFYNIAENIEINIDVQLKEL